ncbi:transporter substrate-binding and LysM peptidoglycan-binding domain-containing protein [Chitinimonas taiwanensis]|uniref:ABC-type amino acid transport substrate-binding protein n=1 Tax=Chitinimonas taiwanensis DSM 18899 TaxID=1121279 RepID=A0A1K2HJN5_9NEIS|nr:transporter substrate-binding domain-containing protein [Chitinimonas taiwanensis]SFZ76482.1 ABC-type amino acid transport substrate-binding protein [Chitinimonas taiwanensis DSM 18899]
MKLTPLSKGILSLIVLAGVGSVGWNLYKQQAAAPAADPVNVEAPALTNGNPVAAQPATPAAAAPVNAAQSGFNSYQSIVEKGVVRVSVQAPAKPFYWLEGGAPKGFNVEFMKLLFAQSEFTQTHPKIVLDTEHAVDTYPAVPEQLLKTDSRGKPVVDIAIDGLTFTDEDLPGVVYTTPYVSDFGYALITGPNSAVRGVADMAGKKLGVLQGDPDVQAYARQQFPNSQFVELSDASSTGERDWIKRALQAGQVDAIIYDYPFGVAEIAGSNLVFAVAKLPQSDVRYKIGVRKGDTQLLQSLNVAISKVKESPAYLDLLKKYFISNNLARVTAASGSETVYVVKTGDTLSIIATRLLGNKARYAEIEARNNLPNPDLIQVGQKLVIPKA